MSHEAEYALAALREVFPNGMTAEEIAASEHNKLPLQIEARHFTAALTALQEDGLVVWMDKDENWCATRQEVAPLSD